MAEDTNNNQSQLKDIGIISFNKGLHTDNSPVNQPEGTWRYALNLVDETSEGDDTFVTNERSNYQCSQLKEGYVPIGWVYINNNRMVIFSVNTQTGLSEIGVLYNHCEYTELVNSPCLEFNEHYQIDAVYRLRASCEDTIYWVDGLNNDRYFNINKPELFYSEEYKDWLSNPVGPEPTKFDCSKFDSTRAYDIPCFKDVEVNPGGSIPSGTYNFSIRLLDADRNPTAWLYSSQLVPIYGDNFNSSYNSIYGSSYVQSDPIMGINPVNKSIKLILDNLDSRFEFYQIAVIKAHSFNGEVSSVVISDVRPINDNTFIYDGNESNYTIGTKEELEYKTFDLKISQHIEQLENRLIKANVKGSKYPWCDFQSAASQIASTYIINEFDLDNQSSFGNAKNPDTYFQERGYLGDEVYAMGIVYVFKDGIESPAYHIPGRPFNTIWDNGSISVTDDSEWMNDNCDTSVKSTTEMQFWQSKESKYEDLLQSQCSSIDYWGNDFAGNPLKDQFIRHHRFPSRTREHHIGQATIIDSPKKVFVTITDTWTDESNCPEYVYPLSVELTYEIGGVIQPVVVILSNLPQPSGTNIVFNGDTGFELPIGANLISIVLLNGNGADATGECFRLDYRLEGATPSLTGLVGRSLGIKFHNIVYPNSDIIGHYFVRMDRDAFNRTIIDKGISGINRNRTTTGGDISKSYVAFTYFDDFLGRPTMFPNCQWIMTPNFQFYKEAVKPEYLKVENLFTEATRNISVTEYDDPEGSAFWGNEVDNFIKTRIKYYSGIISLDDCSVQKTNEVNKYLVLDKLTSDDNLNPGFTTVNMSWDNDIQFTTTTDGFTNIPFAINYTSLKVNRDVHSNLWNAKYQRIHNCLYTLDSDQECFGGDIFIVNYDRSNSLYQFKDSGVGNEVLTFLAAAALAAITVLFPPLGVAGVIAGGTLTTTAIVSIAIVGLAVITSFVASIGEILTAYKKYGLEELAEDIQFGNKSTANWTDDNHMTGEALVGIYIESEINLDLQFNLKDNSEYECTTYLKKEDLATTDTIRNYYAKKWLFRKNPNTTDLALRYTPDYPVPCAELYYYNKDYSRENLQSVYYSLQSNYNCCSDCRETFPTRVIYSEQSFQEELSDNYRTFLLNNYRDIEGETGEITDITRFNNNLYIHTEESIWQLPAQYQERVTDEIVSYIGTGAFFSIPPRKILDDDIGSAGTQHKWATIKNKYGIFFASEREHSVYMFDGKMSDISKSGNKNWFKNNLRPFLKDQFIDKGIEFPFINNNASDKGIGIHSAFDPRHDRIILTKRDYKIINDNWNIVRVDGDIINNPNSISPLQFDTRTNDFFIYEYGILKPISFDNFDYFENKSFTISYSLVKKMWLSYHSYIPNFYTWNNDTFFSYINKSNFIWKHDVYNYNSYQTYYGKYYPHIIEVIHNDKPYLNKITDDFTFQTEVKSYDNLNEEWNNHRYVTFNKISMYNNRQCSGELEMIVKDTESNVNDYMSHQVNNRISSNEIIITREERNWNINDLRDIRIDYDKPIHSKKWNNIKNEFPIDKVINLTTIDFNKNWYELESFRDKFITVRLTFYKQEHSDKKLIFNYNLTTNGTSYR